jgi:peptidylprolyl isomerase
MAKTQKNDFVELEFVGKTKDGEIFDTNIENEAKKIGIEIPEKKFIVCIGQGMLIKGFDSQLADKEIGQDYTIEIKPEEAFGKRKSDLIRLIPKSVFLQQKIEPQSGMTLALDDTLVKVVSVSGGRVLVDFNNPLAGKEIIYDFKIIRKVQDLKEKIDSIIDFYLKGQKIQYEISDKVIFKAEPFYKVFVDEINKRFKDILAIEMQLQEKN